MQLTAACATFVLVCLTVPSVAVASTASLHASQTPLLLGVWHRNANASDVLPLLSFANVTIAETAAGGLNITRLYVADDAVVRLSHVCGGAGTAQIGSRVWPHNVFSGLEYNISSVVSCSVATASEPRLNAHDASIASEPSSKAGHGIHVDEPPSSFFSSAVCGSSPAYTTTQTLRWPLLGSQKSASELETHTLSIAADGNTLCYAINASLTNTQLNFVFERNATALVSHGAEQEQSLQPTASVSHGTVRAAVEPGSRSPSPAHAASDKTVLDHRRSRSISPVSKPQADSSVLDDAATQTTTQTKTQTTMYNFNVHDAWTLSDALLQENVLVMSLQGLVNRQSAQLYLTYPADWAYSYTPAVRDYVAAQYSMQVTNVTLQELLAVPALRAAVEAYVVWDPTVRESLVVSLTAAGVYDALVVAPAQVAFARSLGLTEAFNFNGRFRNMTPTAIYSEARTLFFADCDASAVVWMGGECGTQIRPGIADYGISRRSFFTDLNTDPSVGGDEYPLANSIVAEAANRSEGDFLLMG